MKILLLLILLLSAPVAGQAQSNAVPSPTPANAPQTPPDVEESTRLGVAATKLYNEGKIDEALPLAKKALELREKVLEKDHALVNVAALNLAEIQYSRRKFTDSRSLFERVLRSYERVYGVDDAKITAVLDRLALNYYALGQASETEKAFQRALAVRKKALGVNSTAVAHSLYNLAEFYQFQGQYTQAEPLYEQLIEIRTEVKASSDKLVEALDRYACLLRKQKRRDEAEQVEARSFSIQTPDYNQPGAQVAGGIVNGKALNLVQPYYPAEAISSRATGKVTVRITISGTGSVLRACAIEGPPVFYKQSESAAMRSKFSTTLLSGKPVRVNGLIIYNFVAR
jgi:tetratricopeptide (TPR) repeat protein